MYDAMDEAIYLGSLIEIYCNSYKVNKITITIYTDNRSRHQNIHSTKQVHEKCLNLYCRNPGNDHPGRNAVYGMGLDYWEEVNN